MAARDPRTPGARFSEKKRPTFLKFIEPVTPLWVLYPPQIMRVGFSEPPLAGQCLQGQLESLDGSQVPQNPGSTIFRKKRPFSLKFIGPVTPLWVLYPSENMLMGFTESLLARAVFARSIKVFRWQPWAPKSREHDFPKKTSYFFEIHRTTDTSMGSVSL